VCDIDDRTATRREMLVYDVVLQVAGDQDVGDSAGCGQFGSTGASHDSHRADRLLRVTGKTQPTGRHRQSVHNMLRESGQCRRGDVTHPPQPGVPAHLRDLGEVVGRLLVGVGGQQSLRHCPKPPGRQHHLQAILGHDLDAARGPDVRGGAGQWPERPLPLRRVGAALVGADMSGPGRGQRIDQQVAMGLRHIDRQPQQV